ncbi:MAG TPA: hypothetical protein VFO70_12940 [Chitinophagaceae bacterium]|nr:hypothetical protein [Chitinophagaceae bacterium]
MHIEINDNTRLSQIQETFSNFYPFLEIRFYKKAHKKYESSDERNLISPEYTIGEVKQTHVSAVLEMQPHSKVAEVEKEFLQRFGLSVQILRKEKNDFVQTTGMDDFTLKELNEFGRNSSDDFIVSDYEEGFEENPE